MTPHVIVIDDFLPNAHQLRARALKLNYTREGPYPGLNSVEKISIPGLDQIVSKLVYQPVRTPWTKDYSHGNCRIDARDCRSSGIPTVRPQKWTH